MYVSRLCFYEYLSRSVRVTNFHLFVSLSRSFVCLCVWLCLHFGSDCISDLGVLSLSISMGHLSLSFAVLGSSVSGDSRQSLCLGLSESPSFLYSCISISVSFLSLLVSVFPLCLGLSASCLSGSLLSHYLSAHCVSLPGILWVSPLGIFISLFL